MTAPNIPMEVRDARLHQQKIPLGDVFADFLSSFAALNKDPRNAFNFQAGRITTRFSNLNKKARNLYFFVTPDMLAYKNLFKIENMRKLGDADGESLNQFPVMEIENGSTVWDIQFSKGPGPGHDHIFSQTAKFTTVFRARTLEPGYIGTKKFFAAANGKQMVHKRDMIVNACINCFGLNDDNKLEGFADIEDSALSNQQDESGRPSLLNTSLLATACKGDPTDAKMMNLHGSFWKRQQATSGKGSGKWAGAKKIGDVADRFLPLKQIREYAEQFFVKNFVMNEADKFTVGEAEPSGMTARDSTQAVAFAKFMNDVGKKLAKDKEAFQGFVRAIMTASKVDEDENGDGRLLVPTMFVTKWYGQKEFDDSAVNEALAFTVNNRDALRKFLLTAAQIDPKVAATNDYIKLGNPLADQLIEILKSNSDINAIPFYSNDIYNNSKLREWTEELTGKSNENTDYLNGLGGDQGGDGSDSDNEDEEPETLTEADEMKLEDFDPDTFFGELKKLTEPKLSNFLKGMFATFDSSLRFQAAFLKFYKAFPLTPEAFLIFDQMGIPLPFAINVFTTNIVYKGHAMPGVVPGRTTGYAGMSNISMSNMPELRGQVQVDTYVRFAVFISDELGFARREMLLVNKTFRKDSNRFLCMNQDYRQHDLARYGANNTYQFVANDKDLQGNIFCLFDVHTNELNGVLSYLGYNFTCDSFMPRDLIADNDTFGHYAAPIIMNLLDKYSVLARKIKTHNCANLFNEQGEFVALPGFTHLETIEHFYAGRKAEDELHPVIWPATEEWMNAANALRSGQEVPGQRNLFGSGE